MHDLFSRCQQLGAVRVTFLSTALALLKAAVWEITRGWSLPTPVLLAASLTAMPVRGTDSYLREGVIFFQEFLLSEST